tara:strand:+ start:2592 stop:3911 length:1320 start_codon:yes stop_codon:yes gene_type:complete
MERTSSSMPYEHLREKLRETLAEQEHRHMWRFLYSSRHTHLQLIQPDAPEGLGEHERNQLIDDTVELLHQFDPPQTWQIVLPDRFLAEALHHFCFAMAYTFHRKHFADGFIDPNFEDLLPTCEIFIDNLSSDEMAVVSQLHELTYKYGFAITELWESAIDSKTLIDAFIKNDTKPEIIEKFPSYIFNQKRRQSNGIQISKIEYPVVLNEPWDLAIFFNKNDKISKIRENIIKSWRNTGTQFIGDSENHEVVVYVDRKKCNTSQLTYILRLQADQLEDYSKLAIIEDSEEEDFLYKNDIKNNIKNKKKMKKYLSSTIDRIRYSENLISKRWSIEKSNIRRSVGLYLWDQMNIIKPSPRTRKGLITDLIETIKVDRPKALEQYMENFNIYHSKKSTRKLGDSPTSIETVIRGMESDYYLTDSCIKKFDFLTPYNVKASSKR